MDDNLLVETLGLHQSEAERLFAGSVMIDDERARRLCGWLPPESFRDEKIREFWTRVQTGMDAHEAAMQIGAYYEMASYTSKVATSWDMEAFANTIGTDRYLTKSAVTLSEMARAISNRDMEVLKKCAQSIAEAAPLSGDTIPNAVDVGLDFQAQLDDLTGRSENTYISGLDLATGGLEKTTLTIIAARPSMGKSALGIQIAKAKAEHDKDKRVLLASLEMSAVSIWARMACGELKISWRDVRAGRAPDGTIERLKKKSAELMDRLEDRLLIDETPNTSIEDIWRKVGRYNPDFLIIDHMGLIAHRDMDEVLALGQVSWGCKMIAKKFDIPVIALYQLNRGTEQRDNKRPEMKDIRGSGKIEENADNIFFLYRSDYYDEATAEKQTESKTEIIIAKFRDGLRNISVNLDYQLQEQWFYSKGDPRR